MKASLTTLTLLLAALGAGSLGLADSAGTNASGLRILKGPSIERFDERSAIITWTTNTKGKSRVHYGSAAGSLTQTAESPNRWSRTQPYMVHRVLVLNLKPSTTYYYVVESGSVKSRVNRFVTRNRP